MSAYGDYLKSKGATDADIAVLDTPIAAAAYDEMQAKVSAATDLAEKNRRWYDEEIVPQFSSMQQQKIAAEAEAAKAKAIILSAQDAGLLKVAADLGFKKEDLSVPNPSAADPRYVTKDFLLEVATKEGKGIAIAGNIINEHNRLFPDKPLDFEAIYDEATARKLPVKQYWMDKYGVQAARDAAAKSAQDARDAKIREEGAAAARAELASQYGNPNTRPAMASNSPFVARQGRPDREKQPWEVPDNDRSQRRVENETRKLIVGDGARPN